MKADVKVGQIWRDPDRRYDEERRFIRVEAIEQRGLWRICRISSRFGDGEFKPVSRFIRLDRLPKRYRLVKDA